MKKRTSLFPAFKSNGFIWGWRKQYAGKNSSQRLPVGDWVPL